MSFNRISDLPLSLRSLTALEELSVSHNCLQYVPACVVRGLSRLTRLEAEANPLEWPLMPRDIRSHVPPLRLLALTEVYLTAKHLQPEQAAQALQRLPEAVRQQVEEADARATVCDACARRTLAPVRILLHPPSPATSSPASSAPVATSPVAAVPYPLLASYCSSACLCKVLCLSFARFGRGALTQ